ncbi:protein rolling stone [Elysia marginata]|uniref:Protein rolling stone n=1 Tax=Elysia marginata TaxID=1093978 RepID=A0AAV4EC64_9GAST|nr:protein rolling stone [Elysia marginata]
MGLREHLALSNTSLSNHRRPLDFYRSRFHFVSGSPYLLWRVFWAVYHSAWLVAGPVLAAKEAVYTQNEGDGDSAAEAAGKWFIYLSHWVYLVLTVECVTEATVVIMVKKGALLRMLEARGKLSLVLCFL